MARPTCHAGTSAVRTALLTWQGWVAAHALARLSRSILLGVTRSWVVPSDLAWLIRSHPGMTHDRTLDCRTKHHGATHKGFAPWVDHEQIFLRQTLPQLVGLNLFTPIKLHHAENKTQRCASILLVQWNYMTSPQSVHDKSNNITTITSPFELHDKSIKCPWKA